MSAAEPNIAASFFREGDADFVRIAIKGSSDTLIRRVTPGDVERFSREWEIYSHGVADAAPEGTPLDRVPGLSGAHGDARRDGRDARPHRCARGGARQAAVRAQAACHARRGRCRHRGERVMSLLSICQGALREIGEFEVPSTVVGNLNQTAVQILNLANREGRELSRRHPWQALTMENVFTTVTDEVQSGAIPDDFRYALSATWWDRANAWPLMGPATPQQWQQLKSAMVTQAARRWFRIRGDDMLLFPVPASTGDSIAFEYITTEWCESAAGARRTAWAADDDVALLDEELMQIGLIWRFLKAKGMSYAEEFGAYEREVEKAIARDGGTSVIDMAPDASGVLARPIVPDSGFGA